MKETNEIEKLGKTINSIDTAMKTILTVGGIFLGVFAFLFSGMVLIFFTERPDKPEIKYGEFPFTITCELNGEEYTVEDVVICEYAGTKSVSDTRLGRSWEKRLQSGNERMILMHIEENDMVYEISKFYGDAAYYMGDYSEESRHHQEEKLYDDRYVGLYQWKDENEVTAQRISKEDALELYGFRIIEMNFSQPIENTFR